jgi:hypothetical protein
MHATSFMDAVGFVPSAAFSALETVAVFAYRSLCFFESFLPPFFSLDVLHLHTWTSARVGGGELASFSWTGTQVDGSAEQVAQPCFGHFKNFALGARANALNASKWGYLVSIVSATNWKRLSWWTASSLKSSDSITAVRSLGSWLSFIPNRKPSPSPSAPIPVIGYNIGHDDGNSTSCTHSSSLILTTRLPFLSSLQRDIPTQTRRRLPRIERICIHDTPQCRCWQSYSYTHTHSLYVDSRSHAAHAAPPSDAAKSSPHVNQSVREDRPRASSLVSPSSHTTTSSSDTEVPKMPKIPPGAIRFGSHYVVLRDPPRAYLRPKPYDYNSDSYLQSTSHAETRVRSHPLNSTCGPRERPPFHATLSDPTTMMSVDAGRNGKIGTKVVPDTGTLGMEKHRDVRRGALSNSTAEGEAEEDLTETDASSPRRASV